MRLSVRRKRGSPLIRRRSGRRRIGKLLRLLAGTLGRWAKRLDPVRAAEPLLISPDDLFKLPSVGRLDFGALRDGRIVVAYGALDPIWRGKGQVGGIVDLREHATRLCLVANELAGGDRSGSWWPVSENLHLAASLTDLSADTDLQNSAMMCRPAAEYEDVNSQLTESLLEIRGGVANVPARRRSWRSRDSSPSAICRVASM